MNRDLSLGHARPLKRNPAPLSVCLRPTPPKRMRPNGSHEGLASVTAPGASTKLAARGSGPLPRNPFPHPVASNGGRRANAEQWFNDSNKNVAHAPHASFIDDDPPFYLHDKSSSGMDSACAVPSDQNPHPWVDGGHPGVPPRMESSESTSEEFRGVIDDLTVKNKKLREKLRKYEKLHCSHLQEEKLFEVRVHGLPVQRKLELEQLLRGFAASLEEPSDMPSFAPNPEPTSILLDPLPSVHKPSSSSTPVSKPHDSTYASISASGQTLNSQSNPNHAKNSENSDSKGHDVRPYLHDTPRGLLPRRSPFISTNAKRKVVVRRLEELFTGRGRGSKEYTHLHQQQEVSQSAAPVERGEGDPGEGRVEGEGLREARILPLTAENFVDRRRADSNPPSHARDQMDGEETRSADGLVSREGTPTLHQRPTRPLDLDLYRAQVPADNIKYIKHLGVASPVADSGAGAGALNGWVYLNLLVGMAQLHTLNVTLGFIRKAIVDISTKFELSADGRKIRWKGGNKGTRLSSDSGESMGPTRGTGPENDRMAAGKLPTGGSGLWKLGSEVQSDAIATSQASNYNSSAGFAGTDARPFFLAPSNSATSFDYKPLFFRRASSEDEECYIHDDDSLTSSRKAEHSNVLESVSRELKSTLPGRKKESGPIIFYKRADFCTDLSGDLDYDSRDDVSFTRYVKDPIGRDEDLGRRGAAVNESEKLLFGKGGEATGHVDDETDSSCFTDPGLMLADAAWSDASGTPCRIKPVYFEVSGLGGVQPQDNFCVEVKVQHGGPRRPSGENFRSEFGPRNGRRSALDLRSETFHRVQAPRAMEMPLRAGQLNILSSTTTLLPPSILPEPSYINLPFSSDNEEDDDNSSENSDGGPNGNIPPSSVSEDMGTELANQMPLEMHLGLADESSAENSCATVSDGSDDSSSIDLLAHARVLDPETVAAREREFDSNVGLPLAEVPAGSSAATAGGGSGVPSEMSDSCSEATPGDHTGRRMVKRRRT